MKETVTIPSTDWTDVETDSNNPMAVAVEKATDYWYENIQESYEGWMLKTYNIEVKVSIGKEQLTGIQEDLMYFMLKWA